MTFVSGELLTQTKFKKASSLADEFIKIAVKHQAAVGDSQDPAVLAKKLALEFHKQIVVAMDIELKQQLMKKISC